jgi:dephospho-CoA kinase
MTGRSTPFVIAVTGSIGMGKSTTANMFGELGVPVWDADAAVHRLYASGGDGAAAIERLCPDAVVDGGVNRDRLKHWIASQPTALAQIEFVIHPLVARDRQEFVTNSAARIVVVDVPLLFETGYANKVDLRVVTSVDAETQRQRVLARPGMNETQFAKILARQMPDAEKRRRADVVIETYTMEDARAAVQVVLNNINESLRDA